MITWLPSSPFIRAETGGGSGRSLVVLRDSAHVDGLGPELHATTVTKQFGDWYATCSCQAMSLPCWNQAAAERWVCPRVEAEAEVLRAKVRYDARVVDAGNWGRA